MDRSRSGWSCLQTKTKSKPYLTELEKEFLWSLTAVMMASTNVLYLGQSKNVHTSGTAIQLMKGNLHCNCRVFSHVPISSLLQLFPNSYIKFSYILTFQLRCFPKLKMFLFCCLSCCIIAAKSLVN